MVKKRIEWLATALFIIAGVSISTKVRYFEYSYVFFAIGHTIYSVIFLIEKRWTLLLSNIFFLSIDFIGMYNWII